MGIGREREGGRERERGRGEKRALPFLCMQAFHNLFLFVCRFAIKLQLAF